MIQNPVESVNALEKLADILGKKTLVMWCIVTTFTTGYLFIQVSNINETRIKDQREAYERIVDEIKDIRKVQKYNNDKVNETKDKLDTLILDAEGTLNKIRGDRR